MRHRKHTVEAIEEIKDLYISMKDEIRSRLNEFKRAWKTGNEKKIFNELIFCILTPQSKAKYCWAAVENLHSKNLLLRGDANHIAKELNRVRFKHKKAGYIIRARKQFSLDKKIDIKSLLEQFSDVHDARDWLVQNAKGIGYKEASHFLRNIGFAEDFAILDRHVLKNLKLHGVIEKIPNSLSKKRYFEIEKRMKEFSKRIEIPMADLDLLLWYKETGEIFK
jgi:N-glycosylase/DNA lyase